MVKPSNVHEVNLDIRPNGLLCVPVKINEKGPYPFVLDTGTGGNSISPAVAEALQLKPLDFPYKYEHVYDTVAELAVESAQLSQFIQVEDCSDLSRVAGCQVDGMLGYPFIREFHMTINYAKQTLILEALPDLEQEFTPIADDYNRRGNWHDVLQRFLGWKLVSRTSTQECWKVPGASGQPWEAVFHYESGQLYACPLGQTFFHPMEGYSPFDIYACIKHNENFSAATKDLASQGFGLKEPMQPDAERRCALDPPESEPGKDMSNHRKEYTEIKLQIMDNIPFVPVTVDGEGPFLFLLDTGAAGESQRISPAIAQTLQIDPDSPRDVTLAVGDAQLKNLPARVMDFFDLNSRLKDHGYWGAKIDGYIGYSFLREFIVTTNYKSRTLILARS